MKNKSTKALVAEYRKLAAKWDASRIDDEGHFPCSGVTSLRRDSSRSSMRSSVVRAHAGSSLRGGSPGEWLVEEMGEIEQELKNRGADELIADVTRR